MSGVDVCKNKLRSPTCLGRMCSCPFSMRRKHDETCRLLVTHTMISMAISIERCSTSCHALWRIHKCSERKLPKKNCWKSTRCSVGVFHFGCCASMSSRVDGVSPLCWLKLCIWMENPSTCSVLSPLRPMCRRNLMCSSYTTTVAPKPIRWRKVFCSRAPVCRVYHDGTKRNVVDLLRVPHPLNHDIC